jgi:hypothetical protein
MKLSSESYSKIRTVILRKLVMHNIWGAKHTNYEFVQKGLPKELRGFAKDVADDLIKNGILLSHPTSYGMQISLNPDRAKEIKAILGIQG